MSIAKLFFVSALFVPFLVSAQEAVLPNAGLPAEGLPKAGLTPESPFYFFDKFGEAMKEFFTFNPEGKARLQITFAAERIAEIKVVLETKGVRSPGLEVAQSRLTAHLTSAVAILDKEKAKGKDVSKLANDLDDEFEGPKSALEQTFKTQKHALEDQKDELKDKISDARRAGDTAQVEALTKQLAEVKAQKDLLEQNEDGQEEALEKEEERIKEEIEDKAGAEKKILKAEKEKQKLLDEAAEEGVVIPAEAFNAFDEHLAMAKAALAEGKFKEAKEHAKEARKSLDKIDDAIDDLEKAKEEEDEEDEKIDKDAKKAAEQVKKAEERLKEAGKIEEEEEEMNEESHDSVSQTKTVFIRSGRFDDNVVDIKKGDTVKWVNNDSQPHWPASNPHPVHTGLPGLDALKQLEPGGSYEFTFTQSGAFGYHDHLNPAVTGQVIVK